jgi:Uma2 family endonuclease
MVFLTVAPELVVEVLSPSNSVIELNRYARLCLANGAQEFWSVDYESRSVRVQRKDKLDRKYEIGDTIEISIGARQLAVSDVF